MHRGSSKGGGGGTPAPETLPLSASPPPVRVVLRLARAGRETRHELTVPRGTPVRVALARIGVAAEGCAVLVGARPLPLDEPLDAETELTVVTTFSGG